MSSSLDISIQYRRDTTTGWATLNPILQAGEIGLEVADIQYLSGQEVLIYHTSSSGDPMPLFKYGDGVSAWNTLPHVAGEEGPAGPPGSPGPAPAFRSDGTNVVYSYDGFVTQTILYSLASVTGPVGAKGDPGPPGAGITLSDSVTSTSSSEAASSKAVNTAYLTAQTAQLAADSASTAAATADSKATSAASSISGKVDKTQQILVTAPLTGGGSLTGDLTIGMNTGAMVTGSRRVNTTAPLAGGGPLSADLTITVSLATNSAVGVVKPDGLSFYVDGTGALKLNAASMGNIGGVPAGAADGTFYGCKDYSYKFMPLSNIAAVPNCVVLWNGTPATVPTGWILCDGNNGTPNLTSSSVAGLPWIMKK